jgi:hypothetical protein
MLRRVALLRTDVSEGRITIFRSVFKLLVTPNAPSSLIVFTLMMEAIQSSETRAARRHIAEYGILHSHYREYLQSYIALTCWTL